MLRRLFVPLCTVVIISALFNSSASADDLQSAVKTQLSYYYNTPFEISTETPGHIIIKGTVHTYWDKLNIFGIISRVRGVNAITNELAVETDLVPNNMIKANIENSFLQTSTLLEPKKIHVAVDNGEVILSGTVSFAREAIAAEDIAAWHKGVLGVFNQIEVLPPKVAVSDDNLREVIQGLIQEQFSLEKQGVEVQVHNGVVTLMGKTTTFWAKNAIAKEILRVPGVLSVENKIQVKHKMT